MKVNEEPSIHCSLTFHTRLGYRRTIELFIYFIQRIDGVGLEISQ